MEPKASLIVRKVLLSRQRGDTSGLFRGEGLAPVIFIAPQAKACSLDPVDAWLYSLPKGKIMPKES